jgi:YihY family inner membrane protein
MSTANHVPETWTLSGDDAWETLKRTGRLKLAGDAFRRFRAADGTSHARSLAFLTALLMVQAVIALVAFASTIGKGTWSALIVHMLQAAAPGPAGEVFSQAVDQAHQAGSSNNYGLLLGGLVISLLVTAGSLMGQVERGLNRIYGIEQDRPTLQKYGRALVLAFTAGLFIVGAFAAIAVGHSVASSLSGRTATSIWNGIRWPLGLLMVMAGTALVFRWSPRRRQPAWSWLTFGASVAVVLWMLATEGLAMFFRDSSSFGQTYGPVSGLVALLLWSLLTSVAVLYGGAVAAQLEAVRAGAPAPKAATSVRDGSRRGEETLVRT